jgi:hypothetical protein
MAARTTARRPPLHLALGIGGALFLLFWPFALDRRVPLLGWVDLGFHELGHMLAIPLGTVVHFLAGSGTQMAVPLGLAVYFWVRQRDHMSAGLMMAWAAAAWQDVSVYIADAPFERLQLIGGDHDWAFLLHRWDALDQASGIASMVKFTGLMIGLAGIGVIVAPLWAAWRARARAEDIEERFADAPVRPVKNPPKARPGEAA